MLNKVSDQIFERPFGIAGSELFGGAKAAPSKGNAEQQGRVGVSDPEAWSRPGDAQPIPRLPLGGLSPQGWLALLHGCMQVGNLVAVMLAAIAANLARYGVLDLKLQHMSPFIVGCLLSVICFGIFFRPSAQPSKILLTPRQVVMTWTLVMAGVLLFLFIAKITDPVSRLWILAWYGCGLGSLLLCRVFFQIVIKRSAVAWALQRRAIVVLEQDADLFELKGRAGVTEESAITGMVHLASDPEATESPADGFNHPSLVADITSMIRRTHATEVILALPWEQASRVEFIVASLRHLPVEISWVPESATSQLPVLGLSKIDNRIGVVLLKRPLDGWQHLVKRFQDFFLASLLLVVLAPLMLVCAIAVVLSSPGPVFYCQRRVGFNGRDIDIFKFRSMYVDQCDAKLAQKIPQTTRVDGRVTPVGRFLRKTSLDELPQLFNVLRGEMSLVGPRPHAIAHDNLFRQQVDGYLSRYRVKPGITGWAQINGYRGETDTVEKLRGRIEHDMYYIDNWSVFLDLKIMLKTALLCAGQEEAY